MKKFLALLLAVLMIVSCTACGKEKTEEPKTDEPVYDANKVYDLPETVSAADVENPIVYFSVYLGNNVTGESENMTATLSEVSTCDIDYMVGERKVGKFVPEALDAITAAFDKSGLAALNGQSVYEEGDAFCSMFVQYADGTAVSADFSGAIPEEFTNGWNAMNGCFKSFADALPKYVPQPAVTEGVDETVLSEMMGIFNKTEIEGIDTFTISNIPMDEFFGMTAGLSKSEGITNGTLCAPMMITTPYSLVIVTVEDKANIEAVRADFEASLDWQKWVCVIPNNALIAEKDNMVICLVGSDDLYNKTADAIGEAGWKNAKELDNPGM